MTNADASVIASSNADGHECKLFFKHRRQLFFTNEQVNEIANRARAIVFKELHASKVLYVKNGSTVDYLIPGRNLIQLYTLIGPHVHGSAHRTPRAALVGIENRGCVEEETRCWANCVIGPNHRAVQCVHCIQM